MHCQNAHCKKVLPSTVSFCPYCGASLKASPIKPYWPISSRVVLIGLLLLLVPLYILIQSLLTPVNKKLEQYTTYTDPTNHDTNIASVRPPSVSYSEINDFVYNYLETQSKCNISEILKCYDNNVNYFGAGIVDKKFIQKDKEKFCQRWPIIQYKLTGEINVENTEDENIKIVEFYINFYTYNSKRGSISGRARNYLKVHKTSEGLKIIDDQQKVLNREKNS